IGSVGRELFAGLEKSLPESRAVGEPLLGILRQGPIEEPVESGGAALELSDERHLGVVRDGVGQGNDILAVERSLAAQRLVEEDRQGEEIAASVQRAAPDLLG